MLEKKSEWGSERNMFLKKSLHKSKQMYQEFVWMSFSINPSKKEKKNKNELTAP